MVYFGKKETTEKFEQLEHEIHELNIKKINIVEKTNITFTRLARPTDVGANKYYKDLNFSELGIPNGATIINISLNNRAYAGWNGFFHWYKQRANVISLEMWEFASDSSNAIEQLKNQKFQITYFTGE